MDDQRYILFGPTQRINLGVRGNGTVFLDNTESKQRVNPIEPRMPRLSKNDGEFGLTVFRKTIHLFQMAFPCQRPRGSTAIRSGCIAGLTLGVNRSNVLRKMAASWRAPR
jgi:hypothetical protein